MTAPMVYSTCKLMKTHGPTVWVKEFFLVLDGYPGDHHPHDSLLLLIPIPQEKMLQVQREKDCKELAV